MSGARVIDGSGVGRPIGGIATGQTHQVKVRRRLIPVVFVPGIMGSRLATADGQKRWDPDAKGFMFRHFVSVVQSNPGPKKQMLIGPGVHRDDYLRPFTDDAEHNADKGLTRLQVARGWGGVSYTSYGDFLRWLAGHLAQSGTAVGRLGSAPAALTEMPVFVFPYNWTGSCAVSGRRLAEQIPHIITQARQELDAAGVECPGVLLVTHSMGGLVARAACRIAGAQGRVVGVVHGVQPAVGAAAAYWRMKAGFPRSGAADFPAMALGKDGREVVALLGNMPGGLELLPSGDYRTPSGDTHWLHWPTAEGHTISGPSDPYADVYKRSDVPWRLIPNPRWLDVRRPAPVPRPSGVGTGTGPGRFGVTPAAADPAWIAYLRRVTAAQLFHQQLSGYKHPQSAHFWGAGGRVTPATVSFTSARVRPAALDDENYGVLFGTRPATPGDPGSPAVVNWSSQQACDVLNGQQANWGEYRFYQPVSRGGRTTYPLGSSDAVWQCDLRPASEAGDGTVPTFSGSVLGRGNDPGMAVAFTGVDHEGVYRESLVQQRVGLMIARLVAISATARR